MARDINKELGIDSDSCSDDDNGCDDEEQEHLSDVETSLDQLQIATVAHRSSLVGFDGDKQQSDDSDYEDASDIFETGSLRSCATTIAPEEIKQRVKKQMFVKEKREQRKRCVAKGEASAVTRSRRENRDNIKQSEGIWGD